MMNEIAKPRRVILMRSGAQIWIDEDKAVHLFNDLNNKTSAKMLKISGEIINTADISGIHSPEMIVELNKSKSGMWKCEHGNWIPKGKRCQCNIKPEYRNY